MLKVASFENSPMIRWALSEIMARYEITGVDLARKLDLTDTAISRMRRRKSMPAFSSDRLGQLCNALNDLIRESGGNDTITPADLLIYTYDGDAA